MSEPITTDKLAALVAAVDAGAEERGWNGPPILVRVEAGAGPDDMQLGLREIDDHPLPWLLGFTAPDEWLALGVCCEGWAAPMGSGDRPSRSKGRMRMRSTSLVSRDGLCTSGLHLAGNHFEAMAEEPVGTIADALHRALRLPTPAADVPIAEYLASLLLTATIRRAQISGGRVGWPEIRPTLLAFDELARHATWSTIRNALIRGGDDPAIPLSPDMAAWMDDGMCSRWLLGQVAPYELLLEEARRSATGRAYTEVRALLGEWGLRTQTRGAA